MPLVKAALDGDGPSVPAIASGELLCAIASTVSSKPIPGVFRPPRTCATALSNIRRATLRLREASTPASGVPTQEEVGDEAALLRGDRTAALRWLIAARRTALSRKIEGGRQEDGESAYPQPTGRRAVAGGGGLSVEVGMAVESGLASEGGLSSEDAWLVRVEVPSAEGGAEAQLLPRVEEASAAEEAAAALAAAKVEAEAAAEVAAKAAAEAEAAAEAAAAALAAAKTE